MLSFASELYTVLYRRIYEMSYVKQEGVFFIYAYISNIPDQPAQLGQIVLIVNILNHYKCNKLACKGPLKRVNI